MQKNRRFRQPLMQASCNYHGYKMEKVLVVGASGATGRLLVQQLLHKGVKVVAIVRVSNIPARAIGAQSDLQEVEANISEMSENDLALCLEGCEAVFSCLGHNLTFKGMFGNPRLLVTDTVEKVSRALESINPNRKVRFILMNTTGNSNRDIPEKPPLSQRCVISVLRMLLPPHADNEKAADFLRLHVGQGHKCIEWVVVRPDSLTNEEHVTKYEVYPSPTRNAIFDAAATSRINVANFMSNLATNPDLWSTWKGKMPVIYNHA
jgi:putative NADH-flavin reductase